MKSALAIDFTKGKDTMTLPLYRGLSPNRANDDDVRAAERRRE